MQEHIASNFRYPELAQANGIHGRVLIMFYINKNGNLTNIKHRGPNKLWEQEAERIITLLPQLAPGLHNGKAVRIPFSILITFKLQ